MIDWNCSGSELAKQLELQDDDFASLAAIKRDRSNRIIDDSTKELIELLKSRYGKENLNKAFLGVSQ